MVFTVCCGTETDRCPLKTDGDITVEDRRWQKAKFECPGDTKAVGELLKELKMSTNHIADYVLLRQ